MCPARRQESMLNRIALAIAGPGFDIRRLRCRRTRVLDREGPTVVVIALKLVDAWIENHDSSPVFQPRERYVRYGPRYCGDLDNSEPGTGADLNTSGNWVDDPGSQDQRGNPPESK